MNLTFRQYFELTSPKQSDYMTAMQDELGIDPEVMKASPYMLSNFKLGDTYNVGSFKIVGYEYGNDGKPTMAKVQLMNGEMDKTARRYKKVDGQMVKVPQGTAPDTKIYLVPIAKLNAMMSQPLTASMASMAQQGMQ